MKVIERLANKLSQSGITARIDYGFRDVLHWPNKAKQVYRCVATDHRLLVFRKAAPGWTKVMDVEEAFEAIKGAARK